MQFVFIVVGGLVGAMFGGLGGGLGVVAGATIGYLLFAQSNAREQIDKLVQKVELLQTALRSVQEQQRQQRASSTTGTGKVEQPVTTAPEPEAETSDPVVTAPEPATEIPEPKKELPPMAPVERPVDRPAEQLAATALDDPDRYGTMPAAVRAPRAAYKESPPEPEVFDNLAAAAKRWLTTGNVPVKLGVIVSFFGVAFLLKYAVDHRVVNIPIEVRYLFIAAATVALLVFGWRFRETNRAYGLSLQGGAIGILYLTIFAAFNVHNILPSTFAFFLLVLLTIVAGVLAVLQDARALAILGVVGGFLAPVLVSSGSGNHVALFSYYLVLNIAILGIAWHRSWRSLNILGFVFTFGVATLWGHDSYTPQKFASTEPFLVLFFLFYTAIPVLYAFRQPPNLRGIVDGTLVFGTPSIAFALQSLLVNDTEYGLAISAVVLAVFYALLTIWLHRRHGEQMRLLVQSFLAMAVTFATVAIPLALDDRWSSVSWALEGAALVWIGVRQNQWLPKIAGAALSAASGYFFVQYGWQEDMGLPVLNGNALGGALISVAALFSSRLLGTDSRSAAWQLPLSVLLLLWGLCWWFGTGTFEIEDRLRFAQSVHVWPLFVALSFAGLGYWALRKNWTAARRATFVYLACVPVVAILYFIEFGNLLVSWGWFVWPLLLVAHLLILRLLQSNEPRLASVWHYGGAMLFTLFASYEAGHAVDAAHNQEVWSWSAALLVVWLVAFGLYALRRTQVWPLTTNGGAYKAVSLTSLFLTLGTLFVLSLESSGAPTPMSYIPILNPFDLLTIVALLLAWRMIGSASLLQSSTLKNAWAVLAFLLSTFMVVRGVFHLSDLRWDWDDLLAADSVQTALSIYWAILGIGGMIWGARNMNRRIWVAGSMLMVLVVAKLFMVDFSNSGTIARIVSFIGVGVLLLLVGYFAPAPPRGEDGEASP